MEPDVQPSLFWSAVRRHWILLLVGFILAGGGGFGMWYLSGPTYTASATVTLIPPGSTPAVDEDTPTRGNPLFYLGGLNQARDLVMSRLRSSALAMPMEAVYPHNSYSVNPDALSAGPVIVITVSGPEPAPVLQEVQEVVDAVPAALTDLQSRLAVPEYARIGWLLVTMDTETTIERRSQIRNAIVGFAGVLGLTWAALALLVRHRLRREWARDVSLASAEPEEAPRRGVPVDV